MNLRLLINFSTWVVVGLLMSGNAMADSVSENVLTLKRLNFKSFKQLNYDVLFDPQSCLIDTAKVFDFYYTTVKTNERLPEMSNTSLDYFGPVVAHSNERYVQRVPLKFKAFDEIRGTIGGNQGDIFVSVEREETGCRASAEVVYRGERYVLSNIDIQMITTFTIPTGVDWVRIQAHSVSSMQPVSLCVMGDCK